MGEWGEIPGRILTNYKVLPRLPHHLTTIITMLVGTSSLSGEQMIEYLRTLPSIRERCGRVHDLAKQGKLQYFVYHPEKEEIVTDYCIGIIRVCISFGDVAILLY